MIGKILHVDNVFAYGFSQFEEDSIRKMLPTQESYLTSTDCFIDIIACSSYAIFLNTVAITENEWEMLWEYYLEIGLISNTIILVGNTIIPKQFKSKVQVFPNFEELQSKLKYIMLSAYQNNKKREEFSNTLANSLIILSSIRSHPSITTAQLAEKLEISRRSVQRYIETLRVAGEWIEYDRKTKGWKLTDGKSILWGDW